MGGVCFCTKDETPVGVPPLEQTPGGENQADGQAPAPVEKPADGNDAAGEAAGDAAGDAAAPDKNDE